MCKVRLLISDQARAIRTLLIGLVIVYKNELDGQHFFLIFLKKIGKKSIDSKYLIKNENFAMISSPMSLKNVPPQKKGHLTGKTGSLQINEIFYSIQGEGSFTGHPCVFVRLMGCNLRCRWCDTTHSFYEGRARSFADILGEVQTHPRHLVEITGGEPLLQRSVIPFFYFLDAHGHKLLLETSGSVSVQEVPDFVHIIMDLKAPGSGEALKNRFQNIALLKPSDDLKFVVSNEEDFRWAEQICLTHRIPHQLEKPAIIQPVFEGAAPLFSLPDLARLIKESAVPFRLGVQLHKYIYPSEMRGV